MKRMKISRNNKGQFGAQPQVQNMRATTILVYVEGNGHALGKVTNDNGRTGEMRVVGAHMWRYEVCLPGADATDNDGGFPSAEEALTALMEMLGLP